MAKVPRRVKKLYMPFSKLSDKHFRLALRWLNRPENHDTILNWLEKGPRCLRSS